MTQVKKFWPLLTGTHKYEKTLSTRNRGQGVFIEAPILAYLIETGNGRILYDVGCDYQKINDPLKRAHYYENDAFPFGPPEMTEEQRLENRLRQLGLQPVDMDLGPVNAMRMPIDEGHFFAGQGVLSAVYLAYISESATRSCGKMAPSLRVRAIESPGHTAGHMSMLIELPKGPPIILAGDAADLQENIDDEIAPGLCWHNREDLALDSIRKLKNLAIETGAQLWPNHDIEFYRRCHPFPMFYE